MKSDKILDRLFLISVAMLIVALPLSKYFMSVAEFSLTGVFILDGIRKNDWDAFWEKNSPLKRIVFIIPVGIRLIFAGIYRKFKEFFSRENLPAIVFSSIYFIHIIGLVLTTNFEYALKDLRIKFPIFLLPLIFSTTGFINRERFKYLMLLFIASVLAGTIISLYILVSWDITDIREVSLFISHIRFSLLICIAIFMLLYLILKKNEYRPVHKFLFTGILLWLVLYLILVASITGLVILTITSVALILHLIFQERRRRILRFSILAASIIIPTIMIYYFVSIAKDVYRVYPVEIASLEKITTLGNPYWHDLSSSQVENGYYVWYYVATDELKEAWNNKSDFEFEGEDKKGQEIKYTIIRFLTSKGYHKDADGVSKLTDEEVSLIENGVANIVYHEKPGLYVRLYKIIWEYKRYQATGNPSGHSAMQRFEYWKAALGIVSDNWLIGVGTGDLNQSFEEQYEKMNSLLEEEFRWRSHNQFLAVFVGFGVIGVVWFLFSLIYPPVVLFKFYDYFYLTFFIIMMVSMISEDTIESQAGATIFAFFSSFYLFLKNFRDPI